MQKIYSIFDKISGLFCPPFQAVNEPVAIRMFNEFCSRTYQKSDYELYYLADFDVETGNLVSSKPVFVSRALDDKKEG